MVLNSSNSFTLDFQASDEAWYTVRLVLQGESLIVKYCNFRDTYDETFNAADLKEPKNLKDFIARLRPTSLQLQDNECKEVDKGMTVCASYVFNINDIRFYDAVVNEVNYVDHKLVKPEVCTCKFVLYWLFGPNKGRMTDAAVGQICLKQSGDVQMDQTLSAFLNICREKSKMVSCNSGGVSGCHASMCDIPATLNGTTESITKSRTPHSKEVNNYKHSVSTARISKGLNIDHWERPRHDINLGGTMGIEEKLRETSNSHYILIENLETDLSSSAIVDFLKKHVSIASKAQGFPSLSSEVYTMGIIVVDSQEELQKLSHFLCNPAHMIVSSRGRPWVITEKKFGGSAAGDKIKNLTLLSESWPWDRSHDGIKIVRSGTEEYKRGSQLKDLFLEFANHQQALHQRLASEEGKILQLSNVQQQQL